MNFAFISMAGKLLFGEMKNICTHRAMCNRVRRVVYVHVPRAMSVSLCVCVCAFGLLYVWACVYECGEKENPLQKVPLTQKKK